MCLLVSILIGAYITSGQNGVQSYDGMENRGMILLALTMPNIFGEESEIQNKTIHEFSVAKDRYSIKDIARDLQIKDLMITSSKNVPVCDSPTRSKAKELSSQVKWSVSRLLNFYSTHSDNLGMVDFGVGLATLRGVDEKYQRQFESRFPLRNWTNRVCEGTGDANLDSRCRGFVRSFSSGERVWRQNTEILDKPSLEFGNESLGTEKESIWPMLTEKCLDAILIRCEVPLACERVMFDPQPRTQYMLSHQLLFRIFAQDRLELCGLSKSVVDNKVNSKMCAKMYRESELIWDLGTPHVFRDLFAENVAFCGHLGYTDFFRMDWLEALMSWQSRSEYGCFLKDTSNTKFVTTDRDIPRMLTNTEISKGVKRTNEICQPHLSSVGLAALSVAWDYLEANC